MNTTRFRRRISALSILVTACTLLNGCVYLRLLKLKRQFRDFERYVRIDERNRLTLLFNEPVLTKEDIVWLLEGEASVQARSGRLRLLKYDFEKIVRFPSPENNDGVPLAVSLHFEDGKLYKLRFPREFSKHLQPALLRGSLQSMGKGAVNKQNKSVSATAPTEVMTEQGPQIPVIPTKSEIEHILGPPSHLPETSSGDMLYYQYTIRIRHTEKAKPLPILRVWLHFSPEDGKLRAAKSSFHGLTTTIAFQ